MNKSVAFVRRFVSLGLVQWKRGDPLLMGAAIAYNTLFALVPLALAFVSIVTLFDISRQAIEELRVFIQSTLPQDVASFLGDIIDQSLTLVSDDQGLVLAISVAVALWSGSRAVYAVQKALRLIQGGEDDRGYFHTRMIGILVTVAAMFGVLAGYALLLFGEAAWVRFAELMGLSSGGLVQLGVSIASLLLGYVLLWAIYRFGPPDPVPIPLITAAIVEVIIVIGTRVIFDLAPTKQLDAVAVFGVLGIILVWVYFMGVVLVAAPIAIGAGVGAWSARDDIYPDDDEREPQHNTDPGSQERGSAPSPAAQ